jgi:hypothetical protein
MAIRASIVCHTLVPKGLLFLWHSEFGAIPDVSAVLQARQANEDRLRPRAMEFDDLRSIGHNIADLLADGNGFLIGHADMQVFAEACQSPERFIEVDFLTGTSSGGRPSPTLARTFALYGEALPSLCMKHGISHTAFRRLSARFFIEGRDRTFHRYG